MKLGIMIYFTYCTVYVRRKRYKNVFNITHAVRGDRTLLSFDRRNTMMKLKKTKWKLINVNRFLNNNNSNKTPKFINGLPNSFFKQLNYTFGILYDLFVYVLEFFLVGN